MTVRSSQAPSAPQRRLAARKGAAPARRLGRAAPPTAAKARTLLKPEQPLLKPEEEMPVTQAIKVPAATGSKKSARAAEAARARNNVSEAPVSGEGVRSEDDDTQDESHEPATARGNATEPPASAEPEE